MGKISSEENIRNIHQIIILECKECPCYPKNRMKQFFHALSSALICLALVLSSVPAGAEKIPVQGTVTLIDLGADSCIPCKMMAPILDKLKDEYKGRAAIIFIDVWKTPQKGKKYGINTIPTQIIYDKTGKERYRHVGFWPEKEMKKWLDMLLAL